MDLTDVIELRLRQFRLRHTGKDPFGPWTDLKELYRSLKEDDRPLLVARVKALVNDDFWGDFARLFLDELERQPHWYRVR